MHESSMSTHNERSLAPLYGLVLNGGKSKRMKQNKASLQYHGKAQLAHAFDLLSVDCEEVFVSTRQEQALLHAQFPQIHDTYRFPGPVNGILSALTAFPDIAWLALANDLPHVDAETIQTLIRHRNPQKAAVAYYNSQRAFTEPLCTIYEPIKKTRLLDYLNAGGKVFREVLEAPDIRLLPPQGRLTLLNVNYPEEYTQTIALLSRRQSRQAL